MPVDKKSFEIAKDPSKKILEFLMKEPDKAFSVEEIYNGIPDFKSLEIPLDNISSSLEYLYRFDQKVEVAWLKGDKYYRLKESKRYVL